MMFLLPLASMPAFAEPESDDCFVQVRDTVPTHQAAEVPIDVDPVFLIQGGCGEDGTVEVFRDGVSVDVQTLSFDPFQTVYVDWSDWTPGAWSLELGQPGFDVIDRVDFTVVDTPAAPAVPVVGTLTAASDDRYTLRATLTLDEPDANVLIAVEHPNGTRIELGSSPELSLRFSGGYVADEICLSVEGRGLAAAWSEPRTICGEVALTEVEEEAGCGCATPARWGLMGLLRR